MAFSSVLPFLLPTHSVDCAVHLLLSHSRALLVSSALFHPFAALIDDFCGACAVKGNGAVASHVKRVDHDDVFDALLFREETLTRHYFILIFVHVLVNNSL